MRHEMKQARQPAPHAQGQHHVAELADGGIGQHPLNVGGHQRDGRGDEQRDRSDVGNDQEHIGGEHGIEPPHEIDTRCHHRGRMHQRRNRGWPLHGIRQPDKQRELRTFPDTPAENPDARHKQQPLADTQIPPAVDLSGNFMHARCRIAGVSAGNAGHIIGSSESHHAVRHLQGMARRRRTNEAEQAWLFFTLHRVIGEMQRPQGSPQRHQADQHAKVADTIDDEGLIGGGRGTVPLEIEADQKPGTDTDQLPEDEHHGQITGNHDAEHREAEQRKGLKKPAETPRAMEVVAVGQMHFMVGDIMQLVVHIPRGIDVDAGGDECDHHKHQHGQGIDIPTDRKLESPALIQGVPVARIGYR